MKKAERTVRRVGPRPTDIAWVPGVSWHSQIELLYRREHIHRCWSQVQLFTIWLVQQVLSGSPANPLAPLTPREREVVKALQSGLRTSSIATALSIAPDTVRNHLKHAFSKLGVNSQVELLALVGGRRG